MPIIDSNVNKERKKYNLEELNNIAKEVRALSITAITAAGSGHTGGVMSIADIATALYFYMVKQDPSNPDWEDRDRVFWYVPCSFMLFRASRLKAKQLLW